MKYRRQASYVNGHSLHSLVEERAMKFHVYDEISITIATKLYWKHIITCLSPLALLLVLRTRNNTMATKLCYFPV